MWRTQRPVDLLADERPVELSRHLLRQNPVDDHDFPPVKLQHTATFRASSVFETKPTEFWVLHKFKQYGGFRFVIGVPQFSSILDWEFP